MPPGMELAEFRSNLKLVWSLLFLLVNSMKSKSLRMTSDFIENKHPIQILFSGWTIDFFCCFYKWCNYPNNFMVAIMSTIHGHVGSPIIGMHPIVKLPVKCPIPFQESQLYPISSFHQCPVYLIVPLLLVVYIPWYPHNIAIKQPQLEWLVHRFPMWYR